MNISACVLGFALAGVLLAGLAPAQGAAPGQGDQVFQWSVSGENTGWPDGSKSKGTLYLWVPENCHRVRGLVIMGTNVPEHMLVGHPAIRRACTENDLGLVWAVPSFWRFGKAAPQPGAEPVDVKSISGSDGIQVAFLEKLLDQLAAISGYTEISTAPWLPVGESAHLLMVMGLINERPGRSIAGICVKNPQQPRIRTVPLLWTLGTAQEWGQTKSDIRETYLTNASGYAGWGRDRAKSDWPLSIIVEPGTGHFYCSEALAGYFGRYISAACRARLSPDGSSGLKPVDLDSGVLAHLPLPGQTDLAITAQANSPDRARPWFIDPELAREAQRLSAADWGAAPQFALFLGGDGVKVEPFALNSVTKLTVVTDGEFTVRTGLADRIPDGFVGAGAPLARTATSPGVEWVCGPFVPVDARAGRFRVSLDRAWKNGGAAYVIARHEGDAHARRTVQPAHVTLLENKGAPQKITFPALADVPAGATALRLAATADSGLPVSYFVRSGPALVEGDRLVFTALPPRTRYPVAVTVVAWQWGRATAPAVRTAPLVEQTFHLLAPVSSL